MVRALRIVYAALAWLFLAALVLQVFFAGLMLFGEPEGRALHEGTGWMLHTAVILLPVTAALARAGARAIWLTLALTVVTLVQPILTFVRETPAIAALHPVNAILMTVLSLIVAQGALRLARTERIPAAS
ncbi:MAG TPA: DUF6220 domain-containing protein [Actinomycetota bacterium]